jgi:hypothetical protein
MKRNKISDGYSDIKMTLNSFKPNIAKDFWDTYKMTWVSLQDIEYDPHNPIVENACMDIVKGRALPIPLENVHFSFKIENISRVCLAQITRGRIGWNYVVESQMPEYLNHGVTIPKNLVGFKEVQDLVKQSQEVYERLTELEIPPQDLRYLCLHGQQTSLVVNTNFAALKGFFAMRAENGLTDELNYVARLMRYLIARALNKDELDDLDIMMWETMGNQLDCLGANQKKCIIYDKVFGNTGRYPSGHDGVCEDPDFDFKKSAWCLELKELPKELLFPDEYKMIQEWKAND